MTPKAIKRINRRRKSLARSSPMPQQQSWYTIRAESEDEAEVRIYEHIGLFGVTAKQFVDDLEALGAKTIHVRLNTPGGEAFDGFAIANSLRNHSANIIIHVDGLAASAGSIIAMSGDEIRMADNSFLMIHEAHGGAFGEAEDMRKYADLLDRLNDTIAQTYQNRAGKTRKYWREKMAAETWYSAEEARAEGLADEVEVPKERAAARFDFAIYNHAPDAARRLWAKQQSTILTPTPEAAASAASEPESTPKEVQPMADTTTQSPPASTPAAGTQATPQGAIDLDEARARELDKLKGLTAQQQFEAGRRQGIEEGQKAEFDRFKAISEACPGDPKLANESFVAHQTPAAVKLAFDAASRERAEAKRKANEQELELLRWKQLAATGGYPDGVPIGVSSEPSGNEMIADPKLQAEHEWDHKSGVRGKFSSKERYVAYRSAELKGQLRVQTVSASE